MNLLLGFDIGSLFIKASLLDADSGKSLAAVSSPETGMRIDFPQAGFAEQEPVAIVRSGREDSERYQELYSALEKQLTRALVRTVW